MDIKFYNGPHICVRGAIIKYSKFEDLEQTTESKTFREAILEEISKRDFSNERVWNDECDEEVEELQERFKGNFRRVR